MDIEQIRKLKEEFETAIHSLVRALEKTTDCSVESINLKKVEATSKDGVMNKTLISSVNIKLDV